MQLSEELSWRGYVNQTTYKDLSDINNKSITFYFGVDPSADSMTIGHLAGIKMADCLIKHGHKAILLVGGATAMIGDPDGKKAERDLITVEEINSNKQGLVAQYQSLFKDGSVEIVDNYDWFKDVNFLDFLRDTGKNVPMRQMLGRDFVSTRMADDNAGLSYAEFSYVLIQAYDYLHLYKDKQVTLQICGSDQWGNSIAGVDLVRRKTGGEANVLSMPLIINQQTGVKFGKTEEGAIWLDPRKTTPTQFYQFWINVDDSSVETYLKIFTDLNKEQIQELLEQHQQNPGARLAQKKLAEEVTSWVHGPQNCKIAINVTQYLTGEKSLNDVDSESLEVLKAEIPVVSTSSIVDALTEAGLASSNTEARRLIAGNAVSINGQKTTKEQFEDSDFSSNRLLIRKGKAYKDSALVEKS